MKYRNPPLRIWSFVAADQPPLIKERTGAMVYARTDGMLLSVIPLTSGRIQMSLSLFSIAAAMHPKRDILVPQLGCITNVHRKAIAKSLKPKRTTVMDDGGYHPADFYSGYSAGWVSIGLMPGSSINPLLTREMAKNRWTGLAQEAEEHGLCIGIDDMSVKQQMWWKNKYRAPISGPLNTVRIGTFGARRAQKILTDWKNGGGDSLVTAVVKSVRKQSAFHRVTYRWDEKNNPTVLTTWEDTKNERKLAMMFLILGFLLEREQKLSNEDCKHLSFLSGNVPMETWSSIVRVCYERTLLENFGSPTHKAGGIGTEIMNEKTTKRRI
jgi:hypothetical protein